MKNIADIPVIINNIPKIGISSPQTVSLLSLVVLKIASIDRVKFILIL